MPSGLRCQSPAMRGTAFCYHHARRVVPARKAGAPEIRIELPLRLDRDGITTAIHQVVNALGSSSITPRRASILLLGLQMASASPEEPDPRFDESDPELDQVDFDRLPPEISEILRRMAGPHEPDHLVPE
jgi:hypothetical protein